MRNLLRHKSGRYYARVFANGKETWKSLKKDLLEDGKPCFLQIIPDALSSLQRMRNERPEEFPEAHALRMHEAQKAMDAATGEIKIARITQHDLRQLLATACIESGFDIPTVSRWLGHRNGGAPAMRSYGPCAMLRLDGATFDSPQSFSNRTFASSSHLPFAALKHAGNAVRPLIIAFRHRSSRAESPPTPRCPQLLAVAVFYSRINPGPCEDLGEQFAGDLLLSGRLLYDLTSVLQLGHL